MTTRPLRGRPRCSRGTKCRGEANPCPGRSGGLVCSRQVAPIGDRHERSIVPPYCTSAHTISALSGPRAGLHRRNLVIASVLRLRNRVADCVCPVPFREEHKVRIAFKQGARGRYLPRTSPARGHPRGRRSDAGTAACGKARRRRRGNARTLFGRPPSRRCRSTSRHRAGGCANTRAFRGPWGLPRPRAGRKGMCAPWHPLRVMPARAVSPPGKSLERLQRSA